MLLTRSDPVQETQALAAAQTDLVAAQRALAEAHQVAETSQAGSSDPLAEAEEAASIRVAYAHRTLDMARHALERGDRSRARRARWGALIGARRMPKDQPVPAPQAVSPENARRTHAATVAFVEERAGEHLQDEDLHPGRLNAAEAELEGALTDREQRVVERDARDA